MTTALLSLPNLSPGRDLDAYMHTINAFPILSVEQERALAERFRDEDDLDAARELVLCHLRFVVHLARSYNGYGLPQSDLIQEGNVGLMKAVKRFDPGVGVRLISFAVHWIKAEMHEFILRNWRIVKVATTKAQRKLFFNLRSSKKHLGWLSNDEARSIAEELDVPVATVVQMEGRMASRDVAFDGEGDDDDESAPVAPVHYLRDDSANPADLVADHNDTSLATGKLFAAMEELDDRSRDILKSRWLQDDKETLQSLAKRYEVSAERIRQLERNAMNKLKGLITA